MGRANKSGRDHRRSDVKDSEKHQSDDNMRDRKTREHRRHNSTNSGDGEYDDRVEEEVVKDLNRRSTNTSDRKRDRKGHAKRYRREESQHKKDDKDERAERRNKERDRKHSHSHRSNEDKDNDDEYRDAKRRKQHRGDGKRQDDEKLKHKRTSHRDRKASNVENPTLNVDKSKLFHLGEKLGHPPDTLLNAENDYFEQNQRFRLYLYRECDMTFDDLSSKEARKMFRDFVRHYNAGELEMGYYNPILPTEALEECPSTRHQWSLKISNQDTQNLQLLQVGVRKQTEYQTNILMETSATPQTTAVELGVGTSSVIDPTLPKRHDDQDVFGCEGKASNRIKNHRLRNHVQTVMEELSGGRTEGRERQIEKRQERAAKIHGASKYEQDTELDDSTLYGGSGEDFQRALASSKRHTEEKEAKKQARIQVLQQQEKEKQTAMLQMLGLSHKIGQSKIQIQPRKDASES
jgi:hypothetical protein